MDGNFNNMGMMGMGESGGGGGDGGSGAGKKAVHVKWAGKTIALGTFPSAEADEKCARAKALTRAWRSTMRPKPSREWVMLELERLQVRVVSGRLSRKGEIGGDDDSDRSNTDCQEGGSNATTNRGGGMGIMGSVGSMGNLGNNNNSHRPFIGGGPTATFEASMLDKFNTNGNKNDGMSGGSMNYMANVGNMGFSVNPNQHYEMLKLHHMNLLNEIQETTLMMNLYQQQMLQQAGSGVGNDVCGGNNSIGGGGGNSLGNIAMPNQGQGVNINNMGYFNMSNEGRGMNQGGGENIISQKSNGSAAANDTKTDDERVRMLRELKEDIARQEREASELEASIDASKRKNDIGGGDGQSENKRSKRGDDDSVIQNETSV